MERAEKMGTLLKSHSYRSSANRTILTVLMLILSALMILPFIMMIFASFKYSADSFTNPLFLDPRKVNLNNYKEIFEHPYYFKWFLNSVIVAVSVIVLKGTVVSMAAYAFAKLRFRGRDTLFMVLMSAMMVTSDTTIVARYLLYKEMHLINSLLALIIPSVFGVFFVFLLRQFFLGIPAELSEAAVIDGCSHFKIYYKIIIPLSIPAMLTMALFSFIWSWNDFVNAFVFITPLERQVVPVGLKSFQNEYTTDTSLQMAGICIAIIPVIILFTTVQKYFVEGIALTGIKG
jgi:multiple sugar transport system permease protein